MASDRSLTPAINRCCGSAASAQAGYPLLVTVRWLPLGSSVMLRSPRIATALESARAATRGIAPTAVRLVGAHLLTMVRLDFPSFMDEKPAAQG